MAQLPTTAPTLGATPPAGKQAPGVYRHKLGDLGITQIADGSVTFPLQDGFVTNADKAAVNTALEAAFLPRDQVTIIFNPMVVNTGLKLVLIDTGYGAVGSSRSRGTRRSDRAGNPRTALRFRPSPHAAAGRVDRLGAARLTLGGRPAIARAHERERRKRMVGPSPPPGRGRGVRLTHLAAPPERLPRP